MTTLLASLPILVILFLMVRLRWGASRAGAWGYATALILAIVFFGARADSILSAHLRALILSLDVLLIIWGAYLLYSVGEEAGAIQTIGAALSNLTADRGMQALLIGWVFASFLQGAGGFGVPVAVTAPLLLGLGFDPLTAVLIPSVGHGWAVTFGSFGSSFRALMAATGLNSATLAPESALFLALAALLTGPMVAYLADGWGGTRRLLLKALLIGGVMGGVMFLVAAVADLWNIASFVGGLAGLLIGVGVARWGRSSQGAKAKPTDGRVGVAFAAYGVLIALTVVILLVPPVKKVLGTVVFQVHFPETVTVRGFTMPAGESRPIRVFTHAGSILLYTSLIAAWVYKRAGLYSQGATGRVLRATLKGVRSSTLSILEMMTMATLMQQSGMTEALAQGLVGSVGAAFPLLAPWLGALGAFMTGSNTNSNVVFAALQMRTAELLGHPLPPILAAQTAGAAVASVTAPTKVVVGASTAGMAGREGEVMRRLLGSVALLVLFISLLTVLTLSL